MPSASDVLRANREQAIEYSAKAGQARLAKLLAQAAKELEAKLKGIGPGGGGTYTEAQVKATLASIRAITGKVGNGVKATTVANAEQIAPMAAAGTIRYLKDLDKKFRGLGQQPLALDEAAAMDVAKEGARASVLRRLVEGVPDEQGKTKTKVGILDRYGQAVVGHFEDQMRIGLVTRRPWDEMRQSLIDKSPFLQGAPAHWAERIVRTETMGAHARASLETMKHADDELGDMLKVLCATFDDRTACLTGDTVLSAGVVRTIFRRRYEGPLLRLVTVDGRYLSTTPNHPMLTRRGWVLAGELRHGDDLISDGWKKGAGSARHEYETQRPATLREVFDAAHALGLSERRRGRQEDFHGDGMDGNVDVLHVDGELRYGRLPTLFQPDTQLIFPPPHAIDLCAECGALRGPDTSADAFCFRCRTDRDTRFVQPTGDSGLRNAEVFTNALDRLAALVPMRDVLNRYVDIIPRVISDVLESLALGVTVGAGDAATLHGLGYVPPMRVHRSGYLGHRQPASVKFDRLRFIEVTSYNGHVFNLATSDGYYTANGLYTSNCDSYAVHGQIRRTREFFDTWQGKVMAPPARPNDREIVVPHRMSWPMPDNLLPRSDAEVHARWKAEKRKGSPPPRPRLSTVAIAPSGKR